MRYVYMSLAAGLAAIPTTSHADPANVWRVNAAVSGRSFNMDCRLEQGTGACTRSTAGGKALKLASYAASGDQVNWSIKPRVAAFMSITMAFNGRVNGDRMSGTMTVAGRSGTFTAVRI